MRKLILMRHAKSDWADSSLPDHARPLNARGRRAAPLVGNWLTEQSIETDFILASSAVRVQQTVQLLQSVWCAEVEVLTESALYLATPKEISNHVDHLHDSWQSAMVVGHNPGMATLVSALNGSGMDMPTAAVAVFQSQIDTWKHSILKAEWTLTDYIRPRELEG